MKNKTLRLSGGLLWMVLASLLTGGLFWVFGLETLSDLLSGGNPGLVRLEYPISADADTSGRLYSLDQGSRRLLSFDAGGKLLWAVKGNQRYRGFYESYRLAVIPGQGVSVYNVVLDPEDATLEAEEILSFREDGGFDRVLVRSYYPKAQRGEEVYRIVSHWVRNRTLFYFFRDGPRLLLKSLNLDLRLPPEPESHETLLSLPISSDFVAAAALGSGVLVAERTGGLKYFSGAGDVRALNWTAPAGGAVQKPWEIRVSETGLIYILDIYSRALYRAESLSDTGPVQVFGAGEILALGQQRPFYESFNLSAHGDLLLVDKFNHSVHVSHPGGGIHSYSEFRRPADVVFLLWAAVFLGPVFLVLGAITAWMLVRRLFSRKSSLLIKQIAVFVPLVVGSVTLGGSAIYQPLDETYRQEILAKLRFLADLGGSLIEGELVEAIQSAADFGGPAHAALGVQVNALVNSYNDPWTRSLRLVVYKYSDDTLYFVRNYSSFYGTMFPYGGATRAHLAAARGGIVGTEVYRDEYGSYISGLAPIRSRDGKIQGVLEAYHNWSTVEELAQEFRDRLISGVLVSVLTVIALLSLANGLLLLTLRTLSRASSRMSLGEIGVQVQTRRRDEIGELAQDFNQMSASLKDHFLRLKSIQEANSLFVPSEFLSLLGRSSLSEVRAGMQIHRPMTLFFADIRSFTSLSEGMTPKENFDFVNQYLSLMGPLIRQHGGFIDRYLGDAIMALFPGEPEQAVRAGLAMREALPAFNAPRLEKGLAPVDFGVGLHTEAVTLGVVGEEERLAVTVVSAAVDLVNALESATKKYHVQMVVTAEVWQSLPSDLRDRARGLAPLAYRDREIPVYGF